jgi:16S rRNA G527 N7-methylase RsmG
MPWKDQYAAQITAWDRVHRLVGRSSPRELIDQSVEALLSLPRETLQGDKLFVDVGAGSGLLGVSAMELFHDLQCLFVEPDAKKTAFLRSYLFSARKELSSRSLVSGGLIQDVSRETLKIPENLEPVLFARAFSGPVSLSDAVKKSVFAGHQLFVFRSEGSRHFFEKLC